MMNIITETRTHVFINLNGAYFWSRLISPMGTECDCMNCHIRIGDNIPIRLFLYGGRKGELVFCHHCAGCLGVLSFLGIPFSRTGDDS